MTIFNFPGKSLTQKLQPTTLEQKCTIFELQLGYKNRSDSFILQFKYKPEIFQYHFDTISNFKWLKEPKIDFFPDFWRFDSYIITGGWENVRLSCISLRLIQKWRPKFIQAANNPNQEENVPLHVRYFTKISIFNRY